MLLAHRDTGRLSRRARHLRSELAGPSWAGLVSTFPSLSLVVLIVTYLESGPAEASRIAQVLPSGNTSTLAFLAVFRLVCSEAGVAWGTVAGYGAALGVLIAIQWALERTETSSSRSVTARTDQTAWPHRLEERGRIASVAAGDALATARSACSRGPTRDRVRRRRGASMRFCAAGRDSGVVMGAANLLRVGWIWPSFIGIRRSAAWATSWLWVTITSVSLRESRRWWRRWMISSWLLLSRLPVGSSARSRRWVVGERARDRDALALADGELRRAVELPVCEADLLDQALGTLRSLGRGARALEHRDLDVLERRQGGHQIKRLEDEADLAGAEGVDVELGERRSRGRRPRPRWGGRGRRAGAGACSCRSRWAR